jgi:hypothetical protein
MEVYFCFQLKLDSLPGGIYYVDLGIFTFVLQLEFIFSAVAITLYLGASTTNSESVLYRAFLSSKTHFTSKN